MTRWRSVGAPLAAAALALTLGACGGDEGPTAQCTAPKVGTPPNCTCPTGMRAAGDGCEVDCTSTNVLQESGPILSGWLVYDDFSVPDSGRLDVTLDWTFAASEIGFYLVPANTCTTLEQFNSRSCNFVVRSEPGSTKPRKISTPNFAAGNYRWLVANYSDKDESVSFQIMLAKGSGCAAMAGGSPSAASRDDVTLPAIERIERR